jgi:hypothetical protein
MLVEGDPVALLARLATEHVEDLGRRLRRASARSTRPGESPSAATSTSP